MGNRFGQEPRLVSRFYNLAYLVSIFIKDSDLQHSSNDYPELTALLSGWFHQDFDIEGDTVEAIMTAFNVSSSCRYRQSLVMDISTFLAIGDDRIDELFVQIFNPDIVTAGFAPTTRAFLEEILRKGGSQLVPPVTKYRDISFIGH
jgi:hypothetical protein